MYLPITGYNFAIAYGGCAYGADTYNGSSTCDSNAPSTTQGPAQGSSNNNKNKNTDTKTESTPGNEVSNESATPSQRDSRDGQANIMVSPPGTVGGTTKGDLPPEVIGALGLGLLSLALLIILLIRFARRSRRVTE